MKIKYFIKSSIGFFLFCLFSVPKLLWAALNIPKNEAIILCPEGGFAHTVLLPDVARRLYPNKPIYLIFFYKKYQHNPKMPILWADSKIRFIFIPISFGFKTLHNPAIFTSTLNSKWGQFLLEKCVGKRLKTSSEVYKEIPVDPALLDLAAKNKIIWEHASQIWSLGYFPLLERTKATKPRLPESIRQKILQEIEFKSGLKLGPFCGMYLRQKGKDMNLSVTTSRVGSDFSAYEKTIKLINERGFPVLLHSDEKPTDSFVKNFNGKLITPQSIGVNPDLFALFLATECAFYIGEAGGGSWLPAISGTPTLVTNGFPYSIGHHKAMICLKRIRAKNGSPINFKEFFWKEGYKFELPEYEFASLNSEDLYCAISYFLSSMEPGFQEPESVRNFAAQFPPYSWFAQAHSKLCPYPIMSDHGLYP